MSKKVMEQHWLLSAAIQKATNISRIQCLPKGGDPRNHWCGILVGELDRLAEESSALRESLRLKKAECEALAHDKSVLLSFVKRVSELDIEDWNYETDDGDGMCFEFIGDTEIACDAADLLEDIKNAGKGGE